MCGTILAKCSWVAEVAKLFRQFLQWSRLTECLKTPQKFSILRAKQATFISKKTFGESLLPLVNVFSFFQFLVIYSVK